MIYNAQDDIHQKRKSGIDFFLDQLDSELIFSAEFDTETGQV